MFSMPFSTRIRPSDSSFLRAREPCSDQLQGQLRPSGTWTFVRSNNMGRMNWRKASGYNRLSKVEAATGRYKRVMQGEALRSREDAGRVCEVNIAINVLNRITELGRPVCVRVT